MENKNKNFNWHGYQPISIPNDLPFDIIQGKTFLSTHDFMVYIILRKYSRPCPNRDLPNDIVGSEENLWFCEAFCECVTPKFVCDMIYSFKKITQEKKMSLVQKSIANLIDSSLVICYDKKRKREYTGQEYLKLENYKGVMFYFLIRNGYFSLSENSVDCLIEYCAKKKECDVAYFVLLYAVLEYNFKISRDKQHCWLDPATKDFFIQRERKWAKFDDMFSEIGITRIRTKESYHGTFVTSLSFQKDVPRLEEYESVKEY